MKIQLLAFICMVNVALLQAQDPVYKALELNSKGYGLLKNGEYEKAIYYFDRAIETDTLNNVYYINRAFSKSMIGDNHGALKDYFRLCVYYPAEPEYFYQIGNQYQKLGKPDSAIVWYDKAIGLVQPPDYSDSIYSYYFNRGTAWLKLGNYKKSTADLDTAISMNSVHYPSYANRAIGNYHLNKIQDACIDWMRAYELGYTEAKIHLNKNCDDYLEEMAASLNETNSAETVKIPPVFKGGMDEFGKFITSNIRYPVQSQENGEQGFVLVEFTVFHNGEVGDARVIHSASHLLDKEAVRVILQSSKKWIPGKVNNAPADVSFISRINFVLSGGPNPFRKSKKEKSDNGNDSINFDEMYSGIQYLKVYPDLEDEKFIDEQSYTIYFDSTWQITHKEDAAYYRTSGWSFALNMFDGKFTDFDMNGNLIAEGQFTNGFKNGRFTSYYTNGKLKTAGYFENNNPARQWAYYYDDGSPMLTVDFTNPDFLIIQHLSVGGDTLVSKGAGIWGWTIESYLEENEIQVQGEFQNYLKTGTWRMVQNNKLILEETYEKGEWKKGRFFENDTAQNTNAPAIAKWIFVPYHFTRVEHFIFSDENVKQQYPFIK